MQFHAAPPAPAMKCRRTASGMSAGTPRVAPRASTSTPVAAEQVAVGKVRRRLSPVGFSVATGSSDPRSSSSPADRLQIEPPLLCGAAAAARRRRRRRRRRSRRFSAVALPPRPRPPACPARRRFRPLPMLGEFPRQRRPPQRPVACRPRDAAEGDHQRPPPPRRRPRAALRRRANLRNRYAADGGHACTGSSARYRCTSAASPLAVS